MLILCIADAEKDVSMKNLSPKEAIALLRNLEDSLDSYCELNEEGKTAFRMAIEALNCSEIPNNSDTISRQAAIDEAEKWFFNLKDKRTIGEVLKGLPSEQPETNCSEIPNNWIPCSERLPEDFKKVLVFWWEHQIFDRCEEIEAHLPEGDPDRTGYKMYPDYMTVWKYLHQLPSAQPEPRTAYWTKDIVGSVVCSYCGGIREDNRIGHTQWCNCCGCFMRGEQE